MFAVVATLIAPAAGHVVLGRWRRGVVWLIALLVPVFLFLLLPPYPPALLGLGIALAALRIGVVIDAHRTVETNGIRMHIAEQGTGPVVLLCHGHR